MKKILLLLMVISQGLVAQKTDYNKIILPQGVYSDDYREKLVQIAWQNYPQNEIAQRKVTIASHEITQAKMQWLDIFSAQGNLNEYSINRDKSNDGNVQFNAFPRYNFGASITLGMFGDIPAEIKKKKEMLKISEAELNMQKLAIRGEVLRRYQNYLLYQELLENQVRMTENVFSSFSVAEQRFKNGEISLQDYNESLDKYNAERINLVRAETELEVAQITLEEMLGVSLEEVK